MRLKGVDTNVTSFDQQAGTGKSLGLHKDLRPFKQKYKYLYSTITPMALGVICLLCGFVLTTFSEILFVAAVLLSFKWKRGLFKLLRSESAVFDTPKYVDYCIEASAVDNAPKEMTDDVEAIIKKTKRVSKPGKAIYFLGHELFTGQELHLTDDKARTHIVIFGTTGSGKTETILSICVNFLVQSSGFILVDGKGDSLLFAKVFSVCQAFLRTDDLYLLNFMDDVRTNEKRLERISNTFNFLVETTASEANEIIGGLLPGDSKGGGMWEGRASAGIAAINKAVFYLKENGFIDLDPETYRTYFDLKEFAQLSMDTNIPKQYRADLRAVLSSVNYKLPTAKDPNPQQPSTTEEQFQYIVMQFTSTFNMLAGDYRHICVSQCPDISITDVVLRRRILLVLLPSLAKSPNNVKNLGRIVISMTRNVSSKAIGARVEGNYAEVIDSKPTAAINSFALIFDEYGTYATAGAEQLPAQVRSLNLVCLFAGQDYQAFKKGDAESAATIFANCTIKICMKLEEPDETFERFLKSAGEEYVMVADQYEVKDTMFGRKYIPEQRATVQKKPILDVTDLKDQSNGMATFIYGSRVIRFGSFYADPFMVKKLRILHMLQIKSPKTPKVRASQQALDHLYKKTLERIDGQWKHKRSLEMKVQKVFILEHYQAINETIERVQSALDRMGAVERPSDTELMLFAIMLYMRRVSLLDKQIESSVMQSVGLAVEQTFDDDQLLHDAEENASSSSAQSLSQLSPSQTYASDAGWNEPRPSTPEGKPDPSQPAAPQPAQQAAPVPPQQSAEKPGGKQVDFRDIFDKMSREIAQKKSVLEQPRDPSFDSFKAMGLDAFAVQEGVRQIEDLILRQNGMSGKDAQVASALTARALVVDIGIKTNVALVTAEQQKNLNPARSSKRVRSVIDSALKDVT